MMSEYYTVSQFAQITGKDSGNIRRMLIKGELPGQKFGKQWMISKDAVLPADKRVKTGNYRNWRKKYSIARNNPELGKILRKLCEALSSNYGTYLDRIILYGSYARGEQTAESDIDIALILKTGSPGALHDNMIDLVVDYELEIGVTLSVIPIEYENYIAWHKLLPFYQRIDKEGIVLWKSA